MESADWQQLFPINKWGARDPLVFTDTFEKLQSYSGWTLFRWKYATLL